MSEEITQEVTKPKFVNYLTAVGVAIMVIDILVGLFARSFFDHISLFSLDRGQMFICILALGFVLVLLTNHVGKKRNFDTDYYSRKNQCLF